MPDSSPELSKVQQSFEGFSVQVRQTLIFVHSLSDICQGLVDPFLKKNGWSPSSLGRVRQKHFHEIGSERTVYVLLGHPDAGKLGAPLIIIEAANETFEASDQFPIEELQKSLGLSGCKIGAKTNGTIWKWYCAISENDKISTPFLDFDVSQSNWLSDRVLKWLFQVQQQFHHPDPVSLLDAVGYRNYSEVLVGWWKSNLSQPSKAFLQFLWSQIDTPDRDPSTFDLYSLKQDWASLHQKKEVPGPKPGGKPQPLPPQAPSLKLEDGSILYYTNLKRAWRTKNLISGQWNKWSVCRNGADLQAEFVQWLFDWKGSEIEKMLEDPSKKRLCSLEYPTPRKPWNRVLEYRGVVTHIYTDLKNKDRLEWCLNLAKSAENEDGKSPEYGIDFELWLPPVKISKHKKSKKRRKRLGSPKPETLTLEGGRVLSSTSHPRAWRIKNSNTDRWENWQVLPTAVDVQVAVVKWAISWNTEGIAPLLEGASQRTLTPSSEAMPPKYWRRSIFDGTVSIFTALSNSDRKRWIVKLTSQVTNSAGESPVYGDDYEMWLPSGGKRLRKK